MGGAHSRALDIDYRSANFFFDRLSNEKVGGEQFTFLRAAFSNFALGEKCDRQMPPTVV